MKRYLAIVAGLVLAGTLIAGTKMTYDKNRNRAKGQTPDEDTSPSNRSRGHESSLSAILVIQSVSCECTEEASRAAKQIVDGISGDYANAVAFETIDIDNEQKFERVNSLYDRYEIFMTPALIVLDGENQLVWKCEDFSSEQSIRAKFEQLFGKAVSDEN